ncbi:hypothetical protein AAV99_03510 [Aurantiacibacter marinus]|uniref:O-antigen ligase-related domain-containing protein n=1 Tax=Aurantiacibacter marinus TaxID=874156 RepID=A0A0H0XPT2_9SPHN|nr:hypothetical protein AAV99_03510 [Aurantiacibacter marinus]
MIAVPFLIVEATRQRPKFNIVDGCMILCALWIGGVLVYHQGLANGFEPAGRETVDLLAGYFIMRICVRSVSELRVLLIAFLPGLLLTGVLLAYESTTAKLTFLEWFPPENAKDSAKYQARLGLTRAWGPFPHPILGGLFMATFLPLYASIANRHRVAAFGVIAAICGFFSLSSAAIMALILAIGLTVFWRSSMTITRRANWPLIGVPVACILVFVQLFVGGGAGGFVMRYLSLTPETANYRRLIWEYGSASVAENPIFGIGYAGYERIGWMVSASIDSHWLAIAVRYGLPALFLMIVAAVFAIHFLARSQPKDLSEESILHAGLLIALICLSVMLLTVFAWLQMQALFSVLIGLAVGIGVKEASAKGRKIASHAARPVLRKIQRRS